MGVCPTLPEQLECDDDEKQMGFCPTLPERVECDDDDDDDEMAVCSILPEQLDEQFKPSKAPLSCQQKERVISLLQGFSDIFSGIKTDIGRTSILKHKIETGDARPVRQAPRMYRSHESLRSTSS